MIDFLYLHFPKLMNSFILIAKDPNKQQAYLKKFTTEHAISAFDQIIIEEESLQDSIGIETVRKMQANIFLKPYKGDAKIIVIQNAQNLTIEAQNALLKILEEPPLYLFLFLCTTTEEAFLPTILSRCQIISLSQEKKELTDEEKKIASQQLEILVNGTINEKLTLAEKLASDKENLNLWFEHIILYIRELMLTHLNQPTAYPGILHALHTAHKTFQITNVSPRVILEHTFLTQL